CGLDLLYLLIGVILFFVFSLFQNWIGNYKRSFKASSKPQPPKQKLYRRELSPYNLFCRDILKNKGTMNDIKGRWSTLREDVKQQYVQEAAALKAHGQTQDLSPEMRELKIKGHLKKLKLEVSKLEALGVETAILSFDSQKASLELFEMSSNEATVFLDSTDTVNNFALHFKGNIASSSAATPTTKDPIIVLLKKVQDLFNQRYKEAGGTGRLPYQSLVNNSATIKVAGLPTGLDIKKPSFYGRNQLEAILAAAEQISFEINSKFVSRKMLLCCLLCSFGAQQMEGESSETATNVAIVMTADEDGRNLCCVCRIHFDDKKKNATKKWRSWSQCSVCQSWSHTACGFKRTMCLHCQGQHTMQTA
uniref:Zgc:113176 n=1 Tax=Sander lucioperca TaxID=283035 RepID=A0A8C9ZXI9_SANLU